MRKGASLDPSDSNSCLEKPRAVDLNFTLRNTTILRVWTLRLAPVKLMDASSDSFLLSRLFLDRMGQKHGLNCSERGVVLNRQLKMLKMVASRST